MNDIRKALERIRQFVGGGGKNANWDSSTETNAPRGYIATLCDEALAQPQAAQPEAVAWRCFHCDETFTAAMAAREHFGPSEHDKPACQFDVTHVRWLEAQHRRNVDDDSEALRTVRSLANEHETLRRRAEELGYARGLADAKKHPEELGLVAATPPNEPQEAQPEAPAELRGLDTATRVRFYEHDFYVLSNFSAFTLHWRGLRFDTSEAAYHWEKFTDSDGALVDVAAIRHAILTAPSAHEAFKIAEKNKAHRRPDWDDVKVRIMLDILRAKAAQHEYVRRKLLATGDRELVEDSWRDDFWGWGPNRDGKNMLGRLWMQVRAELRDSATPPTEPAPARMDCEANQWALDKMNGPAPGEKS